MKFAFKFRNIALLGLIAIIFIANSSITFATAANTPNWIEGADSATVSADNKLGTVSRCRNQQIDVVVTYRRRDEPFSYNADACVVEGDNIDVALYYVGQLGRYGTAVRVQGDQYYRHLATGTIRVSYVAEGDTLVYSDSYYGTQMSVVRGLSKNIIPRDFDSEGRLTTYEVKPEGLKNLLERGDQPGVYHAVYSHAVSDNGRYIVAYVNYGGFIKINLETGEEKAVYKAKGTWYSAMYNPQAVAISNDGRYIIIGPDLRVIDTKDCGWEFNGDFSPLNTDCDTGYYASKVSDTVGYSSSVSAGKFIDENYGFEVDISPFPGAILHGDGLAKHVTVKAGNYVAPTPRLEYLALGDSYSSGEGDIGKKENGTSYYMSEAGLGGGCHISTRSYPFLLKERWGIDDEKMKTVACSGARVLPDMYGNPSNYLGQHNELAGKPGAVANTIKQIALEDSKPGIVQQIEFVKKYQPKLITLTGGGNDVGFSNMLAYCVLGSGDVDTVGKLLKEYYFGGYTCSLAVRGSETQKIVLRSINEQKDYTKRLIQALKASSPDSEIYIVGYPSFVAGNQPNCFNALRLDLHEASTINYFVKLLNSNLQAAAESEGVGFVDIEDSLDGGRLCEGSKYMTGPWNVDLFDESERSNLFHPNASGHKKIADKIGDYVESKTKQIVTSRDLERPESVGLDQYDGVVAAADLTNVNVSGKVGMSIHVSENTFSPLTQAHIRVHSSPVDLGTYTVGDMGGLNTMIDIKNVDHGLHLLTIEGINVEGTKMLLYQWLSIGLDMYSKENVAELDVQSNTPSSMSSEKNTIGVGYESEIRTQYSDVLSSSVKVNEGIRDYRERQTSAGSDEKVWYWLMLCAIVVICILAVVRKHLKNQ